MSFGSSGSTSGAKVPADLKPIRSDLSGLFQSELGTRGSDIFQDPGGTSGRIFQNLFGDDPSSDFLGARQALQDTLSGQSLGPNLQRANQQLMPVAMQNIASGSRALRQQAGPAGLRFSTDLINAQRGLTGDILAQTQGQALDAALGLGEQRGQAAQNLFNMAASLRESDLGRLLPMMVNFATQFAPVGSESSSFNASLG